MPRIIYAMSSDGLLFSFLSHIFPPTGTPLIATIITGLFASILALIVSLRDLIGKYYIILHLLPLKVTLII